MAVTDSSPLDQLTRRADPRDPPPGSSPLPPAGGVGPDLPQRQPPEGMGGRHSDRFLILINLVIADTPCLDKHIGDMRSGGLKGTMRTPPGTCITRCSSNCSAPRVRSTQRSLVGTLSNRARSAPPEGLLVENDFQSLGVVAQVLILRPTHPQVTFRTHFGTRSRESSGSLILTCPQQGVVAPFGGREDKDGFSRSITAEHLITHHLALITTFLNCQGRWSRRSGCGGKSFHWPASAPDPDARLPNLRGRSRFPAIACADLDLPFTRRVAPEYLEYGCRTPPSEELDHAMIPDDIGKCPCRETRTSFCATTSRREASLTRTSTR